MTASILAPAQWASNRTRGDRCGSLPKPFTAVHRSGGTAQQALRDRRFHRQPGWSRGDAVSKSAILGGMPARFGIKRHA